MAQKAFEKIYSEIDSENKGFITLEELKDFADHENKGERFLNVSFSKKIRIK